MDVDPRWSDDRNDARRESGQELSHGSRGGSSDPRERASLDPREVFMKDLALPRGPDPRDDGYGQAPSPIANGGQPAA